jgi:ubiquinone/menaquinone biosynthesis C-methylase UbiE
MDRFAGIPAPLSTQQFISMRNESWLKNNEMWTEYVTGDVFRLRAFQMIIRLLVREEASAHGKPMRIADFGCGEGSLLSTIAATFRSAELIGIDNCELLLGRIVDPARKMSLFMQDIESANFSLPTEIDVAMAALSLIEMTALDQCLSNIAAPIRKGGAAILTVLDPTVEFLRMIRFKYGDPGVTLYGVADELVLASHFTFNKLRSPRPYFRFLRPIDQYIASAAKAGLEYEKVEIVGSSSLVAIFDEPRAVTLIMRKAV